MDLEHKEILIELCEKLLEMRMGDKSRIAIIMKRAEEGKILYELDKKYLENKAQYIKFETSEPVSKPPLKQQQPELQSDSLDQPQQATSQQKNDCLCETCGQKIVGDLNFCGFCGAKNLRKNEIKLKTMECNICRFSSTDKEQFNKHFDRAFHISCRDLFEGKVYEFGEAVSPDSPPTEAALNRQQAQTDSVSKNCLQQAKKFPTWVIVIGLILGIGLTLSVAFPNGVTWILWVPILIGYGGWKLRFPKLLIIFLIAGFAFILGLLALSNLFLDLGGREILEDFTEQEKILEGLDEYERQAMSTAIAKCQFIQYQVSGELGDKIKQDCMEKLAEVAANMRSP